MTAVLNLPDTGVQRVAAMAVRLAVDPFGSGDIKADELRMAAHRDMDVIRSACEWIAHMSGTPGHARLRAQQLLCTALMLDAIEAAA